MKYLNKYYIVLLLILGLSACNNISENDRYLDYELPPIGEKTVLLEEFTGWMCTNCPAGSAAAISLQENYNHKVIVISIHAGAMSRNSPYNSKVGDVYWNEFYPDGNTTGYPAAMFDRTPMNGGKLVSTGYQQEWSEVVRERIQLPAIVSMEMQSFYDAESRKLQVSTIFQSNDNLEDVSILYMLTESKIIGMQQNGPTIDREYEHNHVLRGVIGDENENYWGEQITIPYLLESEHTSPEYTLNEEWVPENMSVIGILYYTSNKQVIHAEEIVLI